MSLSDAKKKDLFDYYSQNGFQQPTEKIANQLNICHKTFFNRYGNKLNSIEIAWQYWQNVCREKWHTLMAHCNHSIEALVMTLYSIYDTRFDEPHYYKLTQTHRKYLDPNSFFYSAIRTILDKGKKCFHIQENLNTETYITFLLNNVFLIDIEEEKRPEIIKFIIFPALTERGLELFMETPFNWI